MNEGASYCRAAFDRLFAIDGEDASIRKRSQRLVRNCGRASFYIAICNLIDSFYSATLPFAGRKTNSSSMRTAKWIAVTVANPFKTNPAPRFDLG